MAAVVLVDGPVIVEVVTATGVFEALPVVDIEEEPLKYLLQVLSVVAITGAVKIALGLREVELNQYLTLRIIVSRNYIEEQVFVISLSIFVFK